MALRCTWIPRATRTCRQQTAVFLDRYSLLLMSGQCPPFMHQTLLTRLNAITGSTRGRQRVQHALYLILNSPEYSIQK